MAESALHLDVQGLTCGHGESVVLSDVSFSLADGRSLAGTPAAGSSSSSTLGFCATARAISSKRRLP